MKTIEDVIKRVPFMDAQLDALEQRVSEDYHCFPHTEPTLRDQFAMAALTGIIAAKQSITKARDVEAAYEYADIALKARGGEER